MVEGIGDRIVSAFRFSTSRVGSIVLWGLPLLVIIFLAVLGVASLMVSHGSEFLDVLLFIFLIAILLAIVWLILFLGFICQCARAVLDGEDVMPTGFESPGQLVVDSVVATLIYLEVLILGMLFLLPGIALMIFSANNQESLFLLSLALTGLGLIPLAVFIFLGALQMVIYVDTGSVLQGLNLLRSVSLVISRPADALVTFAVVVAIYGAFRLVTGVCSYCCILGIFTPFIQVIEYTTLIYLVVRFYEPDSEFSAVSPYEASPHSY